MCCCGKPTINGELGYRWQPEHVPSIHPVNPPALQDGETLLFDEPGRCGGLDSHSYHYRVVRRVGLELLVRHGGGDERLRLAGPILPILSAADSTGRYWLLNAIYHAHADGNRDGRFREQERWRDAAIEKRIKIRKQRGTKRVVIVERTP